MDKVFHAQSSWVCQAFTEYSVHFSAKPRELISGRWSLRAPALQQLQRLVWMTKGIISRIITLVITEQIWNDIKIVDNVGKSFYFELFYLI